MNDSKLAPIAPEIDKSSNSKNSSDAVESKNDIKLKSEYHVSANGISAPDTSDQQTKKPIRIRRFSNMLSYTQNSDKNLIKANNLLVDSNKTNHKLEAKIDELYSRLNRITNNNNRINSNNDNLNCDIKVRSEAILNGKENDKLFKCNSMDMLSTLSENDTLSPLGNHNQKIRKISVPAPISHHQPRKVFSHQKRNTRRLSEFTRGEFLNEKS
jgi:hypothetical protein